MIIALSGFMGCGKSSIGKELYEKLETYDFIDLDAFIEAEEGRRVSEIFSGEGEAFFREKEKKALGEIVEEYRENGKNLLLSLGGGTPVCSECIEILKKETLCVYLRAKVSTLVENLNGEADNRPLLRGQGLQERIETLLSARCKAYEDCARYIIDIDGKSYEECTEEIIRTTNLK